MDRIKSLLKDYLIAFLIIVFFVICRRYFIDISIVDGESMEPFLQHGDVLLVEKFSFKIGEVKKDDILIVHNKDDETKLLIKRVIATSGQELSFDEHNKLFIDGTLFEEDYIFEDLVSENGDRDYPIKLAEGEFFVAGDNRNNSLDSRNKKIGNINEKDIVSKAIFRFLPINKSHSFKKISKNI